MPEAERVEPVVGTGAERVEPVVGAAGKRAGPDFRADPGPAEILVVDLLGGIGDLVMALPVVHALAATHPRAALRVVTHAPGDALLRGDPAVTEVRTVPKGDERAGVAAQLDRRPADLVVSTTRHSGIPDEIAARGGRAVTDLWRNPPPDEPVGHRYLRVLASEGVIDPSWTHGAARQPTLHLSDAERAAGARVLDGLAPPGPPVVLVPNAGMAVKQWPHWPALAAALARSGRPALVVAGEPGAAPWADRVLPPRDLRELAAVFAAVAARGGVVVGPDTGPMRVAAAAGARTVGLFGPTTTARYGLGPPGVDLQGLPGCPHRRPTAITEQVCWWQARCPLADGPACMADLDAARVLVAVEACLSAGTAAITGS